VDEHRDQFDLPKAGIWILTAILSQEKAENVLGCLNEEYNEKVQRTGRKESLWCWLQIGQSAFHLFVDGVVSGQFVANLLRHRRQVPLGHLVLSVSLYASLYSIAPIVEIAFAFDRFGLKSLQLAPLIFLWIASTSFLGLWLTIVSVRRKRGSRGLLLSILIFAAATVTLLVVISTFLPQVPLIASALQTSSAYASFLKSTMLFLLLAVVFLIIPFHWVVSKEEELRNSKCRNPGPPETRVIEIHPAVLASLIVVSAFISVFLAAHFIDYLKPGPYSNLFFQLLFSRYCIFYALATEAVLWYWTMLKRFSRHHAGI
jgi:hypothetical protein